MISKNTKLSKPIRKIFAYLRVSTDEQTVNSQKESIRDYCERERILIDEWREISASSRKSLENRGIDQLINELNFGDVLLVSEISRLGRSNSQLNSIIKQIMAKGAEIRIIKQRIFVDGRNKDDGVTKLLLNIFGSMAEFERDILSSRTKDGLKRAQREGKRVGRRKGELGKSQYTPKMEEITYLLKKGCSYQRIINMIGFGKKQGLFNYVKKRGLVDKARKLDDNIQFQLKKVL